VRSADPGARLHRPRHRALTAQLGIARDGRGNIAVDARQRTSVERVYACGDAHKGASLIVWAIALGRETARHVDADLRAGASVLPARGVDQPFERR
jgi:glutamate synthase (NADPH/NADH) small chain